MPDNERVAPYPVDPNEPLCPACGHYESDCICWLGEWCPICEEFECCEATHQPNAASQRSGGP